MILRKVILTVVAFASVAAASAQNGAVTLDSCRRMALENNKQIRIRTTAIESAGYLKDAAFAAYLPSIDFAGGYLYNQKKISMFADDQFLPIKSFNLETQSYDFNVVKNPMTGEPIIHDGQPIPSEVAYLPKEALTYDIHNVFFGAITLTQPIYMGGKIAALNRIAEYGEELAGTMKESEEQNVIYAVDGAYWLVVSLKAKQELAESYVALLDTLRYDVAAMVGQGVATESDLLTVEVKLNEANVDLTKVRNGLVLSRMALAQVCGLPVHTVFPLADEGISEAKLSEYHPGGYNMEDVYARRPDLEALRIGIGVTRQQEKLALSTMLPNIALVGSYSFSNPNLYDGFQKRFSGAFSVGAMVSIPIWHWGGNYNKYRAAKTVTRIAELQLDDAKDMINLQVDQASFKAQEAVKTYQTTVKNIEVADNNLRHANVGFREGVMTTTNVMEAQTAWLKANSEKIDAMIDVYLCDVYLSTVLGTLKY